MNNCMLLKEKSVTDIPKGLTSEYEWNKLSDLDIFYDNEVTKEYEDIRKLSENYNSTQAQKDNCFVIGAMFTMTTYILNLKKNIIIKNLFLLE